MKTNRVGNLLVASILLTLVSTGVKYYNVTQKSKFFAVAVRTHQITRMAIELGAMMTDADNYRLGYLLTSNVTEMAACRAALSAIPRKYDSLVRMTAENESSISILREQVKPQIDSFISVANKILTDTVTSARTSQLPVSEPSRAALMGARSGISRMVANEESILERRNHRLSSVYRVNDIIHYTSFLLICIISGVAIKTLLDKERRNKELLSSLQESNYSLDAHIKERTAELEKKTLYAEKLTRDLQDNFNELQSFYETLHASNTRAEDTLKEMRDLYENAPTGYHSLNADGIIVRMNQTELRWLGYSAEEVLGKMHVTQMVAPEEHAIYRNGFAQFLKAGYVRNVKHTFVRKDGTRLNVLLNATAIYDDNGKYVMSRGVTYLVI